MTKKVILATHTNEEVIKKSLFIGICAPISSHSEFQAFLAKHQDPNATHNCWAFRMGVEYRFNDDGEPSGTAGKPILTAIDGAGFDQMAALVIRHYGGIKLGTGGLARAYGGTIAKNLQTAQFTEFVATTTISLQTPFEFSQMLFKLASDYEATVEEQHFTASGLSCALKIAETQASTFKAALSDATKGQTTFSSP